MNLFLLFGFILIIVYQSIIGYWACQERQKIKDEIIEEIRRVKDETIEEIRRVKNEL